MDVDGFDGLADNASDGVEHLTCGLQLSLLQCLMEEFGAHVLKTREHVFAVSLPVFINELFNFCPIAPSGLNRDLFFFLVVINERPSGQSIELSSIEPPNAFFFGFSGAIR